MGSTSTWFQTLQPPCASVTVFRTLLQERFHPTTYGVPLMGIRQEMDETTNTYIERAERIGLGHPIDEQYKVQATASGLLEMWRNKVLAREPNTFQERRTVIGKVKLETSTPATYYRHCGMANLCGMLMIKMRKLTDHLESEVSALRAEHYAPSHNNRRFAGPNFYRSERERELPPPPPRREATDYLIT